MGYNSMHEEKEGVSVVDAEIGFDGHLLLILSSGDILDAGLMPVPDPVYKIIHKVGGSRGGSVSPSVEAFISVWATTAINETITIPTQNIGTFNATVDWGDSSPLETITTYNGFSHVYAAIGEHTISITGTFPNIYINYDASRLKIRKVLSLGNVGWTKLKNAFYGCANLNEFTVGSTDVSAVDNMSAMLGYCSLLTSVDLSSFDTSLVTTMQSMFQNCTGLTSLDLSNFDTSSVTNMYVMFQNCTALTSLNVSSFDTSSVTNMNSIFRNCSALTSLDVSSFVTSSVTNMYLMFSGSSALTSLDLSSFATPLVTTMGYMFLGCSSLTSLDVSSFVTSSVSNMAGMFTNCNALTSIVGVEDWAITGLNGTGDLTDFLTVGKMTTAQYDNLLINWRAQDPFNGMTPSFGASTYTGGSAAATARQELGDIDGWSISDGGIEPSAFVSVWATTGTFETITIPCQNVGTFFAQIDWGDGTPNSFITAYNDADLAHQYAAIGEHTISIVGVFPNIYFNNAGDKLKIKRVLNLGTVGWTRLNNAFWGCTNLTEFTAGSTDTSAVTNMQLVFRQTGVTTLDLTSFDTSSVTDMYSMFNRCFSLTSVDVSSFDTSSVNNMAYVFELCNALTSVVGLENWDITGLNGTNDLNGFLTNGKMTTAQYDNLLINWEAQASVIPAMTPSFGASKYTGGGAAATAHASLNNTYGWGISDGGIAP